MVHDFVGARIHTDAAVNLIDPNYDFAVDFRLGSWSIFIEPLGRRAAQLMLDSRRIESLQNNKRTNIPWHFGSFRNWKI